MRGWLTWLGLMPRERAREEQGQAASSLRAAEEPPQEPAADDDSSDGPRHYIPMPWRFR